MSALLVAVLLSLVSAVAYAVAAVAQARLAARGSGPGALRLLGSGAWWGAVSLNAAAALLHVVALKYGPLTVVQPLGALTLVAAVPLGARMAGRPVSAAEWRGTALTLAGLAAILATASGPAPDDVLSVPEALAVAGGTATLIGLLSRPGARPGLRHATASGIASGVASALTQTVTVAATDHTGPLLDVRVIGVALLVAVFAAGGLLLAQTAYRGGLGAPLAVVTLANPLAAAVIGLGLLGEHLRGGASGAVFGLFGAGLATWGVVLLSRATEDAAADPAVALSVAPADASAQDTAEQRGVRPTAPPTRSAAAPATAARSRPAWRRTVGGTASRTPGTTAPDAPVPTPVDAPASALHRTRSAARPPDPTPAAGARAKQDVAAPPPPRGRSATGPDPAVGSRRPRGRRRRHRCRGHRAGRGPAA